MTNQGTMTMEGGGGGVSDVLADPARPHSAEYSLEDGTLQLLTLAGFSVTLPGIGLVNLAVSAQSDAVEGPEGVPEPSTLALLSAGLFGLSIIRRRRPRDVMVRPET